MESTGGSEFVVQVQELRLQLLSTRRLWQGLLERTSDLQVKLEAIHSKLTHAAVCRVEPVFVDWLDKLTGEEAWTLSVLSDFQGATPHNLEGILGYSDPKHVLLSLAPLERFGLAECQGGVWRLTRAGQTVALLHQQRLKAQKV